MLPPYALLSERKGLVGPFALLGDKVIVAPPPLPFPVTGRGLFLPLSRLDKEKGILALLPPPIKEKTLFSLICPF